MLAGVAVMVRDKYAVRLAPEQRKELQVKMSSGFERGWPIPTTVTRRRTHAS